MAIASLFIVLQSQAQEVCLQNAWEAYNKGDYPNAIKYAFFAFNVFVFVDNSPASFLYKMFKFKELKRMKADRFLFFRRVKGE